MELSSTAKVPSLRTFLFRLLTLGAIGSTEATNRPTQGFMQDCPNQNPPVFPRRLSAKRGLSVGKTHTKRILNASRNVSERILIASSLAVARNQPDRLREVMLVLSKV
jgi:hypothetical protein